MKRTLKSVLALLLCVLMLVPMIGMFSVSAAPAKVTGFKLSVNAATSQKLTWDAVSGAKGYVLYKYVAGSGYARVATTANRYYTVTKLKNATAYTYVVRAYATSGSRNVYGALSDRLTVITLGRPASFSYSSVGTTWQIIKWGAVSGATGYRVYAIKSGKAVALGNTKATSYKITGLTVGTDYSYRVRAYVTKGKTTTFGSLTGILTVTTAPAKATGLAATAVSSTAVTLKWNRDAKATGYQIFKYDAAKRTYVVVASTTSNTCKIQKLPAFKSAVFRVRAYCSRRNSVYGALSDTLYVTTSPGKVTGVSDTVVGTGIKFTWSAISGVTGYQVYSFDYANKTWVRKQTSTSRVYSVSGLDAGTCVAIRIRAYARSSSNVVAYGGYSDAYIAAIAPAAPQKIVTALNSSKGISITWSEVENATGYQVYRYDPHEGIWDKIAVTSNVSYSDNNLTDTRDYVYKVRAYIAGTQDVYYGPYSANATQSFSSEDAYKDENISAIEESGILGYLYDADQNYYYTASDPWQRYLGFTYLYDAAAPAAIMWYDTIRVKFTYNNLDWMVQLWKGQYGWVFKGAEIGVYTKPPTRQVDFYDCASDENSLMMSFDFYYRDLFSYNKKFSRDYGMYWWCTGFIPGANYIDHDRIKIDVRITLKDFDMLKVFCESLEEQGYRKDSAHSNSNTYEVKGLDVYFIY